MVHDDGARARHRARTANHDADQRHHPPSGCHGVGDRERPRSIGGPRTSGNRHGLQLCREPWASTRKSKGASSRGLNDPPRVGPGAWDCDRQGQHHLVGVAGPRDTRDRGRLDVGADGNECRGGMRRRGDPDRRYGPRRACRPDPADSPAAGCERQGRRRHPDRGIHPAMGGGGSRPGPRNDCGISRGDIVDDPRRETACPTSCNPPSGASASSTISSIMRLERGTTKRCANWGSPITCMAA
jgi:hypothetical protein